MGSYHKGWVTNQPHQPDRRQQGSRQDLFIGHVIKVSYNKGGKITVRLIGNTTEFDDEEVVTEAYPANMNMVKYPIPGELVTVFQGVENQFRGNTPAGAYYYLNVISVNQHITYNSNPYIGQSVPTKIADRIFTPKYEKRFEQKIGDIKSFIKNPESSEAAPVNKSPLKPLEGDLIVQGRFGASIRFSSTIVPTKTSTDILNGAFSLDSNQPQWANGDSAGEPIVIMSVDPLRDNIQYEDVNKETTISAMYVSSHQIIPVDMSSNSLLTHTSKYDVKAAELNDRGEYASNQIKDEAAFLQSTFLIGQIDGGGYGGDADTGAYDSIGSRTPWDPSSYTPGTLATLPTGYSHSEAQGFNLLNSKWIGDLITSAKSHIKTPTFDIDGTEAGNLACASAVSIMFYRAFGVNMLTGEAVKAIPRDIGNFGSKGTSTLGGGFDKSPHLWQKFAWREAQPGDVMNTQRFSDSVPGHIGIVIDTRAGDGSFGIVSNSSKGFAGGTGRVRGIMRNYSVKTWESVAARNPSKTFAWRYIGPKLTAVVA